MAKTRGVLVDLDGLMEASRIISAAIALSLDSADGLTLRQLRALGIIEHAQPLSLSTLADGLGVNASNASRTCDQLVERGLVLRTQNPEDRRGVLLSLSPAGRRTLATIMKRRRAALGGVVARMSPTDQDTLAAAMDAFTAAAGHMRDRGERLSDADGHLLRWLG
jgi:DNA-binding MarR family transcriptional regulator